MNTLRSRLILSHTIPILVILPLAALALVYIIETQVLLRDLSDELSNQANLVREIIQSNPGFLENSNSAEVFFTHIGYHLDSHAYLLGPDGQILAKSNAQLEQDQQPLSRSGITVVLGGQPSIIVTYGIFEQGGEVIVPILDENQKVIGAVGLTQTLRSTANQFDKLRMLVLWILIIELILGVFIGLTLATRIARPIKNVSSEVFDIANRERFDPIPERGPAEIRELAASVNLLASRLKELEETRKRLLANLVHEIGRPLGAILAAIHVMKQGPGDDPEVRHELLEGVENEINRMRPMLDDLAQLHGQVFGTFELHRSPTNFKEWLPTILLPWEAAANQKGLHWSINFPNELPVINIDKDRIAQAIGNLLSNAIKFTNRGGQVGMTTGSNQEMIWIEVFDNGPGIEQDEKKLIFEPFYRSEKSRRFPQGLGLGLTIAREIIIAHGGTLGLESIPGVGSKFTIQIPASSPV